MVFVAYILALSLAITFLIRWIRHREQDRDRQFAQSAEQLGLEPKLPQPLREHLNLFPLDDLLRLSIKNAFCGVFADRDLAIFDGALTFRYTHATKTYHQTLLLWSRDHSLPDFAIQPKSLKYRLDREKADEDTEKLYPKAFSNGFFIRSEHHQILVAKLVPPVFDFFIAHPNATLIHREGHWLFFERNVEVTPGALAQWLSSSLAVDEALAESPSQPLAEGV